MLETRGARCDDCAPMRSLDRRTRDALLCGLVLCQLAYSWMYSAISVPNERTRMYLTVALVDHGTFAIDAPLQRFGRVYDLARFGGHYYTDKAPGASLLAVPVYALARLTQPAAAFSANDVINLVRTYLMLPIALLGFIVLRSLLRALKVSEPSVDVCSLGFSLGSPMLHYGAAFYGHALVAVATLGCLRCLAWAGVLLPADADAGSSWRRRAAALLGAGACAGFCGLAEYQAVVLAGLLGLPLLLRCTRAWLPDLGCFALGALPFAITLLAYNARAFGGPFALSYQHLVGESLQDLHGYGLAGATHPQWGALTGLLFSQHRGLLFTAPLAALGLVATTLCQRWLPRALWSVIGTATLYFVLIVASSSVWYGGWGFGPRLLVPVLGLLAIAAAVTMEALRAYTIIPVLVRASVIAGMIYQQLVHVTFAELPPEFAHPLADSALPLLRAGMAAPNLACKLLPLSAANWLGAGLLLACTVAIASGVGTPLRMRTRWASLSVAALCLIPLFVAAPTDGDVGVAKWQRQVQSWHGAEERCR